MKKLLFILAIALMAFTLPTQEIEGGCEEEETHSSKDLLNIEIDETKISVPKTRVVATVYNAVAAQCNNDPGHTASMFNLDLSNPYKHRIIAVSRDLRKQYPYGTKVKVSGTSYDGIYSVEDTMNKRYKNRIDILINLDMKIGKWQNASIEKI